MKKKKLNLFVVVFIVVTLCVVASVCIFFPKQQKKDKQEEKIEQLEEGKNSDAEEKKPANVYVENVGTMQIDTPYCKLQYPSCWEGYLRYEEDTKKGVYSLTFYCTIKDKENKLFRVWFGEESEGTLIGYITVDKEKVAFGAESYDVTIDDTWTDEEKNIIYAMGDGINEVIQSVIVNENYSLE